MGTNVQGLVIDPEFMQLSPADQQATLAQADPEFGSLSPQDFTATVRAIQQKSIANPANAPSVPAPAPPKRRLWDRVIGGVSSFVNAPGNDTGTQGYQTNVRAAENQDQPYDPETAFSNITAAPGAGFAKSAVETATAIPRAIAPQSTERIVPAASLDRQGAEEKVGADVETIMEYMAGDAALKDLSIGDKFAQVGKIGKFMQSYPALSNVLADAIRSGAVGGAVGGAHGGTEGAITGAEFGAGIGGGAAALGDLSGLATDVKNAASDTAGAIGRAPGAVKSGVKDAINQLRNGEKVAQPEAQASLRTGAQASAADAGVDAGAQSGGIRTLLDEPIENLARVERTTYDTINQAAETDLKSLYDRRIELQDAIEDPTNVANKPALTKELQTTEGAISKGEQLATSKGVPVDTLDKAKAMTQQRYAMEDVGKKLFNNEGVVSGNTAHGVEEEVNIKSAIRQVENLDKPSKFAARGTPTRLEQAFGEDGAKTLKQGLYDAQKAGQSALTLQKWVKLARNAIGVGGAVKFAYELLDRK